MRARPKAIRLAVLAVVFLFAAILAIGCHPTPTPHPTTQPYDGPHNPVNLLGLGIPDTFDAGIAEEEVATGGTSSDDEEVEDDCDPVTDPNFCQGTDP